MKNIIVTGASGGLGQAITNKLIIDKNITVWAVDFNEQRLVDAFKNKSRVKILVCDLSLESELRKLIKEVSTNTDGIDGFIHCAGISVFSPIHMLKQQQIEEVFKIHVYAAMIICSLLSKKGVAKSGCSVVLFSSMAAHEGSSGNSIYAAAKASLEGFVHSTAHDLADRGIRINAIVPGDVDVGMFHAFLEHLTDEQRHIREMKYPLGFGKDKDIASLVAFLLGSESSWITGQCITIDGGHSVVRI